MQLLFLLRAEKAAKTTYWAGHFWGDGDEWTQVGISLGQPTPSLFRGVSPDYSPDA